MVDVNKKGKVNIPGDLNVKNNLTSLNLQVEGETILQNTVIKGDITVFGNITKINDGDSNEHIVKDGILYLGDPSLENSWRLNVREGELYFENKLNGEWVIKQSIM